MSKFVVGQKVRIKAGASHASRSFAGKVVTVSKAHPHRAFSAVEEKVNPEDYLLGGFWDDEAEPVTETAPTAIDTIREVKPEPGINPKDLLGQKKVDLSLIPPAALIYIALAMEDGAKKYGPFNWREKKVRARVYLAAAMRHIAAKLDGEELASDSLKPHLAHAMACLAIYVDAEETGNLQDDRPTPGAASKLIAKWEKKEEVKKETA